MECRLSHRIFFCESARHDYNSKSQQVQRGVPSSSLLCLEVTFSVSSATLLIMQPHCNNSNVNNNDSKQEFLNKTKVSGENVIVNPAYGCVHDIGYPV